LDFASAYPQPSYQDRLVTTPINTSDDRDESDAGGENPRIFRSARRQSRKSRLKSRRTGGTRLAERRSRAADKPATPLSRPFEGRGAARP